jgi:ankyrin repeat protein
MSKELEDKMVSYETELLDACEFGDVESVSNMIANGADPKKQYSEKGETALHWAARYMYEEAGPPD